MRAAAAAAELERRRLRPFGIALVALYATLVAAVLLTGAAVWMWALAYAIGLALAIVVSRFSRLFRIGSGRRAAAASASPAQFSASTALTTTGGFVALLAIMALWFGLIGFQGAWASTLRIVIQLRGGFVIAAFPVHPAGLWFASTLGALAVALAAVIGSAAWRDRATALS